MSPALDQGAKQFMSPPGARTRNNPRAGQNLPRLTGDPEVPERRQGIRTYGPKELGLQAAPQLVGGPGDPPPGFVGGTTSISEWYLYWAFEKVLGPEGPDWQY